jgi:hypothetical protein
MPWLCSFSSASSVEALAFRPAFSNLFLQMTILADAMVFLIQQRVLCGRVGISPCLFQFSADDHFGRCHSFSYSAARPLWKR